MELEDYVFKDKYGEWFVKGHRVPILSVLRAHIELGMDGMRLAERFSTLSLEKVYAVLAYYYANKEEVDRYLRETEDEIERQRAEYFRTHTGPTTEELRARLKAKQEAATVGRKR